jgi:ATP-dependent DNA ligase
VIWGRKPESQIGIIKAWIDDWSNISNSPASHRISTLLRKLLSSKACAARYVEHVANGTDLFRLICDRDTEGVVAKQVSAKYTPDRTTWVKIKNR